MKFINKTHVLILSMFLTIVGLSYYTAKSASAVRQLADIKQQELDDNSLGQFAINSMFESREGVKISNASKQMMARDIVVVSNHVFQNVDQKEHFVMVVMMESGFQKYAQSPTGPKGLTQVAKAAFKEGLTDYCGVKGVADDDVWNPILNLYAGACYYRRQIEESSGNLARASLRYNQGPYSAADKSYSKGGRIGNLEGLEYIAKITYLEKHLNSNKSPDRPDYDPGLNITKDAKVDLFSKGKAWVETLFKS